MKLEGDAFILRSTKLSFNFFEDFYNFGTGPILASPVSPWESFCIVTQCAAFSKTSVIFRGSHIQPTTSIFTKEKRIQLRWESQQNLQML